MPPMDVAVNQVAEGRPSSLFGRPNIYPAGLAILTGLVLAALGLWLATLGGSPFYLCFGVVSTIAGILVWRGHRAGLWLYQLLLALTIIWSLWEVGLDGWALFPRLNVPLVIGMWMTLPAVRRRLR